MAGNGTPEWTQCYDIGTQRVDGAIVPSFAPLPWVFCRFQEPGESQRYVVPTNYKVDVAANGAMTTQWSRVEAMPYLPFPLESTRMARVSGGGSDSAGGLWACHFFSWL